MEIQQTTSITLTPFERQVKQALRLYAQPERLGGESPLASPYFLSRALRELPRPVTPIVRGNVLRSEFRSAAARLWNGAFPASRDELLQAITAVRRDPDDPRYAYIVLELRCFNQWIIPNRTSDIWEQPHLLPGSKSQHYRDFDEAVKRLSVLLLDTLRPALHHERPRAPEVLYSYDRQLAQLTGALAEGQTVVLTGPGGIGKTSLGATALAQLSGAPSFWYTLRPGFNDGISSLLFALGAFLHERGASNLWQYLVTANGVIGDLNLAAGLLRQDLAALSGPRPILCFDDLEHLATGTLALHPAAHTQLLELIDSLRGSTALLLISQRPLLGGDLNLELAGLQSSAIEQLWRAAGRELSSNEAERLQTFTGGNPRLLILMLTLQREGEELLIGASADETSKSLLPAFQRLWRRLVPEERRALQQLSVYQGIVPEDVLDSATLAALERLGLVERDGEGGVMILPALGPAVREDLSPELRETLHSKAAIVRLERGEYTAAAYHFSQSKQEHRAVQVWFPQRQHAIARGEADAARPIFNAISRQRLDKGERKALDIIRAELRHLAGQYEEGLHELEQIDWSDESEAATRLWMLRGEMEDALGYPERALESYGEGIQVTTRLMSRAAILGQRRGLLLLRRRQLEQSWEEVRRAEFDLAILHGLLLNEEGKYDAALEANFRARALADQLDDDSLRARAERQIAGVYGRRQQQAEAVAHASQSIAIYERLGDRVNLEKMRSNLAFIYVQTRQFQAALDAGAPAYAFFRSVHDPYFAAVTGANLAEASYELGDYPGATRYATEVLELGQKWAIPYAQFTLGQVALSTKQAQTAITHFTQSMQIAQQNDDPFMVAYAQRSLGQAYLAAADQALGRQHIVDALARFTQLAIPGEIAATEQLLASLH